MVFYFFCENVNNRREMGLPRSKAEPQASFIVPFYKLKMLSSFFEIATLRDIYNIYKVLMFTVCGIFLCALLRLTYCSKTEPQARFTVMNEKIGYFDRTSLTSEVQSNKYCVSEKL